MSKENEQVLVFPESTFKQFGAFVGVSRKAALWLEDPSFLSSLSFRPRDEMEKDPSFKQLIPYAVITRNGSEKEFFIYQRTKKGGEARLHDMYSLGIGGHINPCDGEPNESYNKAFFRELFEEVEIHPINGNQVKFENKILGALYDDSNDVGKVHFGVVHGFHLNNASVKIKENALNNGQWVKKSFLKSNLKKFENWSQMVIKELL